MSTNLENATECHENILASSKIGEATSRERNEVEIKGIHLPYSAIVHAFPENEPEAYRDPTLQLESLRTVYGTDRRFLDLNLKVVKDNYIATRGVWRNFYVLEENGIYLVHTLPQGSALGHDPELKTIAVIDRFAKSKLNEKQLKEFAEKMKKLSKFCLQES